MKTLKDSLRSHLRAIMALDHSRLGVENKSGRIFSVRQVYFTNSCQQIWVRANQPFILFYTSRLRRKSTMRRCFYHTDLVQNAVFHNFSGQIAFIQYSDHRSTRGPLAKPFKKFPKSPIRPAGSNFWQALNLQRNLKELRFKMIKNLLCFCFY